MLRDRVEELEQILGMKNDQLYVLGLSFTPTKLLGLILHRKRVSRDQAMVALYDGCNDRPDDRVIDVYMCHIRKALKPHDIQIETLWSVGWSMTEGNKQRLRELVERQFR
jgi:two-component system cell cycle response regulator CtrA